MKNTIIITWAGIALLQVGCTLAPKYSRPISPVPEQWPAGVAYPVFRYSGLNECRLLGFCFQVCPTFIHEVFQARWRLFGKGQVELV